MSNSIEYCQSATPQPYESTPMPVGLTSDEYKNLTEERLAMEEKYEEAIGAHEMWKAAKAKEARLEKLRKKEQEQEVAEKKRKKDERIVEEKWLADEKKLLWLAM
ncbi:hypothetical protein EV421DRAFT_1745420, partial [Armillaria borealis]